MTFTALFQSSRFLLAWRVFLLALVFFTATRIFLLLFALYNGTTVSLWQLVHIFAQGFFFDLVYYLYALVPVSLFLWLMPEKLWHTKANALFLHGNILLTIFVMGFTAIAEFLFWNEFNVRFNFISVDYLVYRREVSNNIMESYPVFPLLAALAVISLLIWHFFMRRTVNEAVGVRETFGRRTAFAVGNFVLAGLAVLLVGQGLREGTGNVQVRELASNGPYQLFAAFRNNELNYMEFYATIGEKKAAELVRREVKGPYDSFLAPSGFDITRLVDNPGEPRYNNVMVFTVESLSASFMKSFGNRQNLTPFLDSLRDKSLFFTRMYATGTRTTRGLEAVTLSIPPTPGRSIVKRVGREKNLWSIGNVLKEKGYEVRFLYGGHGYFDNMNAFFAGNGYEITDEGDMPASEVGFRNAWGVADEYLFNAVIKSADRAEAGKKPFFFHIMTTSNHRPYSYPAGRIDIRSHTGRRGAVKYTDWAFADFFKKARGKPWFDKTLFVILADHTAGGAGKLDLPVNRYHIPMIIYAPKLVKPRIVNTMTSQIDVAPTILALLNMDYRSFAYGRNIFEIPKDKGRSLIANYQFLGYYTRDRLSVLGPRGISQDYLFNEDGSIRRVENDAVGPHSQIARAYYEGAYRAYTDGLNRWKP